MTPPPDFARIGDPGAPVGSPEWCLAGHMNLRVHKHNSDAEVSRLKYGLREFKRDEWWRQLTDRNGHQFRYWEDYVQYQEPYGLGMSAAAAEAVIEARNDKELLRDVLSTRNQKKDAEDRANRSRQGQRTDLKSENLLYRGRETIQEVNSAPTGTSSDAMLRRLRKHRPDIHARAMAGEITVYRAAIEAGFRKPREPRRKSALQKMLDLLPQLSAEERGELARHLFANARDAAQGLSQPAQRTQIQEQRAGVACGERGVLKSEAAPFGGGTPSTGGPQRPPPITV